MRQSLLAPSLISAAFRWHASLGVRFFLVSAVSPLYSYSEPSFTKPSPLPGAFPIELSPPFSLPLGQIHNFPASPEFDALKKKFGCPSFLVSLVPRFCVRTKFRVALLFSCFAYPWVLPSEIPFRFPPVILVRFEESFVDPPATYFPSTTLFHLRNYFLVRKSFPF